MAAAIGIRYCFARLPKKGLFRNVAVSAVPGNEDMEVFPEGFPEQMRRLAGRGFLLEGRGDSSPERVKPFGMRSDLFPGNSGGSLAGWSSARRGSGARRIFLRILFLRVLVSDGAGASKQPPGQEPAQIPVAGPVPDEQEDASRFALPASPGCRRGHQCFGTEHQPDTPLPCRTMGLDGSVQAVPVGERNPGKTECVGFFDQFLGMTRSFQEGSVALAEKREIQSSGYPSVVFPGVIPRGLQGTMSVAPGRRKPSRHRRVSGGQKSSRERPAVPKASGHQPPEIRKGPVKL